MQGEFTPQEDSQEHRSSCLVGVGGPPKGDRRRTTRRILCFGDPERDLLAVNLNGRALFLRLRQPVMQPDSAGADLGRRKVGRLVWREDVPRLHVAEGDGVGADAERAPFFADGLRHANDARLCGCVVDLAHAAVQTGHGGDVDD